MVLVYVMLSETNSLLRNSGECIKTRSRKSKLSKIGTNLENIGKPSMYKKSGSA